MKQTTNQRFLRNLLRRMLSLAPPSILQTASKQTALFQEHPRRAERSLRLLNRKNHTLLKSSMVTFNTLRWSLERKLITAAFCLALLLMVLVNYISYQNATQLISSAARVKQTNEILTALTHVSESLTDIEARHWRYLLLGDRTELARNDTAMQRLTQQLDDVQRSLSNTKVQEQRLDFLRTLVQQRQSLFEQSTTLTRLEEPGRNDLEQQRSLLSAGHPLVVQANENQHLIRKTIAELQDEEEALLQHQVEQSQVDSHNRMVIENLGTVLAFIWLLSVYVLLYRQILKRQQLEKIQQKLAQEKELGEMKLQFFSMVSHEFRTPLSVIIGSAQLLLENLRTRIEPERLKKLTQIQSSAKLMTQLLNDILTLARADAGKLECKPELIEMQFFCLNLLEDIQLFSEHPRTIQFKKLGSSTYAYLDERLIYSVLSNLLSNAIKYSPPSSPIDFTLTCEPDLVLFEIKDRGIGIPREEQAHIFEPFRRGANVGNIAGSGLGMAVVKKCLDLHQGELTLESEVGVGTVFTLKIPQPQKHGLFH